MASYEKLQGDIDRESQIDGTTDSGTRLAQAEGAFEFRDVSFVYPSRPEVTVLEKVCIRIPAKKHTAIIGLSGSGKSTIASLALRLHDPNEGRVFFDGYDLHDLNIRDLRSFVSLVQQEPSLLDRSILENIAHGLINSSNPNHAKLRATLLSGELADLTSEVREGQELMVAAGRRGPDVLDIVNLVKSAGKLADAETFVDNLPYGYATLVGSMGRLVSGGQKQRLALARALVKDPVVLIMDEATASLDSTSEQRIIKAIDRITNSRTVLTIAHRLSTITNADNIIVMHKGRVVEEGDHSTLMAKNGSYAELIKMQSLGSDATRIEAGSTRATSTTEDQESFIKAEEGRDSLSRTDVEVSEVPVASSPSDTDEETPEELETPRKSLWALCKGYAPAVRPHLLVVFAALLGSVIVGGAFSGEAVIFGHTVGSLNTCNSPASIRSSGSFYGLMFFVLAIIEFFANVVSWSGFGWVSEKMVYSVRVLSFRSLFEQDLQWHQSQSRTPALLLSYITHDGDALSGLSGSVIGTMLSITVNLVAAIILTHIIAWRIALVCLSLVPLLLGAGLMELRILGQFEEKHETAYTKSVDIGTEAITSIKTVASLSLEDGILNDYRRSLAGPRRETLRVTIQASLCQALTYFLGNCVNALAYWWGAKQIIAGTYTQTQFLIVVFSLLVSALLFSQMFALAPELSRARAASARILGLIEMGSEGMGGRVDDPLSSSQQLDGKLETADLELASEKASTPVVPYRPGGEVGAASSVEFRNVHFSYPARPDVPVLNGLSIDIQPGQFCALVGPSGAGKSTIISLVERMYTPTAGSITVGGVDVTQTRDVSFRDDIALVPQESVLFEGSIAFNLSLGARPGQHVRQADMEEACTLANIHEVIMALPQGYATLCGPHGNRFSGGQRQRLSIARALVRKPRLLLLDEPTSALDAESETGLQEGLAKAARGVTVLAIAHRLRTIRAADRIFLIEAGRCVDRGTHEELLRRSASYRTNVMHQTVAED